MYIRIYCNANHFLQKRILQINQFFFIFKLKYNYLYFNKIYIIKINI